MICQLPWSHDYVRNGNISFIYETGSISCHCLMAMDRAWLYIPKVLNMLRHLSSSHDNGQSIVKYPSSKSHELSVDIIS